MTQSGQLPGNFSSSPRVVEGLFKHRDAIQRHLAAEMLSQREAYLAQLLEAGHSRHFVAERASILLNVVRIAQQGFPATASNDDVARALGARVAELQRTSEIKSFPKISKALITVTRSWARFVGIVSPRSSPGVPFHDQFVQFVHWMGHDIGYLPSSIASCASSVKQFLIWASLRHDGLLSIRIRDVDDFIHIQTEASRRQRTIIAHCRSLRVFFRYAEHRGWSEQGLSRTIRAPRLQRDPKLVKAPAWRDVRKMIASLDCSEPSQCRAKAILLLASIYGLRRSEISNMTLEDLDWRHEILTVRRSKRGRIQQFPLQFEVGEAVIRYLREVRPSTRSRHLFLTLKTPARPAINLGPAMRKVMKASNAFDRPWGMHSLRHACATELLRKGASLRGIADFLGHRTLRSVSVYAHCDKRSLKKIAETDLLAALCA